MKLNRAVKDAAAKCQQHNWKCFINKNMQWEDFKRAVKDNYPPTGLENVHVDNCNFLKCPSTKEMDAFVRKIKKTKTVTKTVGWWIFRRTIKQRKRDNPSYVYDLMLTELKGKQNIFTNSTFTTKDHIPKY